MELSLNVCPLFSESSIMTIILNLGCGNKVSLRPGVTNIDWSIFLRAKKIRVLSALVPLFVSGDRLRQFKALGDNIMVHNLAKGIPFDSNSVDVVYHSHMFEHLDKDVAYKFLAETMRVLKPGGICRIAVPDMEKCCREYLSHFGNCEIGGAEAEQHDRYIAAIIEQCVRREARGTSLQNPLKRYIENVMLGDARRRGETHQWMYDRINLPTLLLKAGFRNPQVMHYNSSKIANWDSYGLDLDQDGKEYRPGSLYVEADKMPF